MTTGPTKPPNNVVDWTTKRWDSESKRSDSADTVDGRVLFEALENLWEQTRHQAETSKERAIEAYAERLAGFHPPAVLRVLEDWPNHDDWWPTLHALLDKLPEEGWRPNRQALPSPDRREPMYERMKRLDLTLDLAEIGAPRWKHLIDDHRGMSDEQLVRAVDQLRGRGQSAPGT